MKSVNAIIATAVSGLFAATTFDAIAADPPKVEKCSGVVKAGKNDCQTAVSACAGTATKDSQKDAWIILPAGTCEKIVGGTVVASKKK
jgi:uncharacterized membrane protein